MFDAPGEAIPAVRHRLNSELPPRSVIDWLIGDRHPFVLSGDWFGLSGCTIIGSDPIRVADPRNHDPFALIDQQPAVSPGDALIGGGWVGWLGYGLGATVEALAPSPPPVVPRPAFGLAFYDHLLLHDGGEWFFEALEEPTRPARLNERLELWQQRLGTQPPELQSGRIEAPELTLVGGGAQAHLQAVAECTERIAAGELFQANLCLRLEGAFDGDPLTLVAAAIDSARPRMGAYVDGLVSLSPERFIRRADRRVTAEPIKGTRPRSTDHHASELTRAELQDSEKDAAELVMIVDLMRNDLGRVCEYGSIGVDAPLTQPHAGVWHRVATVTGTLRDGVRDSALLRATFPPGSVTGAPKVQAMKTIAALESTRREAYTGAIGIASPVAGLDLNVAIRTFETAGGRIWLGVGGGIVADSDPAAELDEALSKAVGPAAAIGAHVAQPRVRERTAGRNERLPALALHGDARRPDPAAGIFETILALDGRAQHVREHLGRLGSSLQTLYGVRVSDRRIAEVQAQIDRVARDGAGRRVRIRVLASSSAELTVTSTQEQASPAVSRPLALTPYTLPGGLGSHKWQDRALLENLAARAPGTVPLLVDSDGCVLEAAHANIWIVEAGMLYTPVSDGRLLAGVTRAELLLSTELAAEQQLTLRRLGDAQAIFLTSSISGRHPAHLA